jgi:hypothetical protein
VGEGGGRAEGCFRILEGVRFGKGWAYRILARVAVGVGVRPPGRLGRLGRPAARPDCRSPGHRTPGLPPPRPRPPELPAARPLDRAPGRPPARSPARPPARSPAGQLFALSDIIPMLLQKVKSAFWEVQHYLAH